MQIEIIGATGAGKSTLIKNIIRTNQGGIQSVLTSYDFVLQHFGLGWVRQHKVRMLLLNLLAVTYSMLHWRKYQSLLRFCHTFLRQLPPSVAHVDRRKIARIVLRNIGIYEIVSRYTNQRQVIIADEGILQIAHYLFVHLGTKPDLVALTTFVQIAPLPEVAVYLHSPIALLVERTLRRGHHRIAEPSPEKVARFITNAVTVFDHIIQLALVQPHAIHITGEPTQMQLQTVSTTAHAVIARQLLERGIMPGSTPATVETELH